MTNQTEVIRTQVTKLTRSLSATEVVLQTLQSNLKLLNLKESISNNTERTGVFGICHVAGRKSVALKELLKKFVITLKTPATIHYMYHCNT